MDGCLLSRFPGLIVDFFIDDLSAEVAGFETGTARVLAVACPSLEEFSDRFDSLYVVSDFIFSTLIFGTENEIERFGFGKSSEVSLDLDYLLAEVEDELLLFEV